MRGRLTAGYAASAADLKFLYLPAASSVRNFKSKSGTRIIELPVPLCFRSSCQSVQRRITNFGNGALDRARLAQLRDLPRLESEFLEHLLGMLAEFRRPGDELAGRARQRHRLADKLHLLALLLDRLRDLEVLDLRIGKRLVDRVDRA